MMDLSFDIRKLRTIAISFRFDAFAISKNAFLGGRRSICDKIEIAFDFFLIARSFASPKN